jgi:hypothetical protein
VLASFYSSGAARRRGGRQVDQRRWRFNLDDFHEGETKREGRRPGAGLMKGSGGVMQQLVFTAHGVGGRR